MGAQTGGDLPIIPEMAPDIIGTVYGFSNSIACASGFFSPMVTAFILADEVRVTTLLLKLSRTCLKRLTLNPFCSRDFSKPKSGLDLV